MRLIIAGSRSVPETQETVEKIERHLADLGWDPHTVLCGEAAGADTAGKIWARQQGVDVESYPADWRTYGKKAGFIRNRQMAELATHLFVIWDGRSPGTKMMVEISRKLRLHVEVRKFNRPER